MPELVIAIVIPVAIVLVGLALEYWVIQPMREEKLKVKPSLEIFPVIVPVTYSMKHGRAATLRLKLMLFNLTNPPRAIHLANSSIVVWPKLLPFLRKSYSIGTPLIGEDIDTATSTMGLVKPATLILSGSPIINYIRESRFNGEFTAKLVIVDESNRKHTARMSIPADIAEQSSELLTWDDYRRLFERD